jgi:predicted alpha-1,6-mannanase (GH76 family)
MLRIAGMKSVRLLTLAFLTGCAVSPARNRQSAPAPTAPYLQESGNAVKTLQTWYDPSTGLYKTTGWWNSANSITVLVDYARLTKSTEYNSVLANTFTAAQKTTESQKARGGFLNKYLDDEGWWALAWIDAYDLTRSKTYLAMGESIFADMAGAWDDTCGGGIWWSKDKNYKNAIANELFLSVAAHLANRTSGAARKQYLAWGNREWKWFEATGMINTKGLINDGLTVASGVRGAASCTNNGKTTWTYNQGVVLGGLVELAAAGHNSDLRLPAQKIATAAISLLVDANGILHDSCEPKCGADGVQFKGIFVRNLVLLDKAHPDAGYESFVDKNADALWKDARGPNYQLAERWSGPFDASNAASQTSALDALVGTAAIHSKERAQEPVGKRMRDSEVEYTLTIDATKPIEHPARGRGQRPGSAFPGHSAGFPVRLDLIAPPNLEENTPIDFIVTNIGTEPINLPISVVWNSSSLRTSLTFYLTSDGIQYGHFVNGDPILPFQPISVELYAQNGDPKTFYSLAPSKAIKVHATMHFLGMKPGTHLLTCHAELAREVVTSSGTRTESLGTVEAIPVEKTFSAWGPNTR